MAQQQDSGDKTEEPTDKRLRDAREKGDVAKSKELSSTATLLAWLALGVASIPFVGHRLTELLDRAFVSFTTMDFTHSFPILSWMAIEVLLWISALVMLPAIAVGLLAEFLHTGPVFTFEKLKVNFDNMNPVKRIGQWFSLDQVMEILKSIVKAVILGTIAWLVLISLLPQIGLLTTGSAVQVGQAFKSVSLRLLAWTVAAFAFVTMFDLWWQHYRYIKKQRMSMRDIRQEHKDNEGDPIVKQVRRQLHRELANRAARQSAAQATALVVNPTHVAIALRYDGQDGEYNVPIVTAKGEDDLALEMRKEAEGANVPIVRNESLARMLLAEVEEGMTIKDEHFDIIADVLVWAKQVRDEVSAVIDDLPGGIPARKWAPPGEDMTKYPTGHPEAKE